MAQHRFYTVDVFTTVRFGGNPLAVFPDAQGLSSGLMQQIAREFNLSETVFVLPPDDPNHTRRLRIFTPGMELPFAGHPTVGTAYVLASIGEIALAGDRTDIMFEEGVGSVPVSIQADQGKPIAATLTAAQLPQVGPLPPAPSILAAILCLNETDLQVEEWEPEAVSCGVPFLFVPVRDREALGRARVNREHWQQHLQDFWAPHLYLLCFDPEQADSALRSRMFAPAMGIEEDPATGAAASALAGYLGVRDSKTDGILHWQVEQGFEMGRPSFLQVQAEKREGKITVVRVGGQSVMVSEGMIQV